MKEKIAVPNNTPRGNFAIPDTISTTEKKPLLFSKDVYMLLESGNLEQALLLARSQQETKNNSFLSKLLAKLSSLLFKMTPDQAGEKVKEKKPIEKLVLAELSGSKTTTNLRTLYSTIGQSLISLSNLLKSIQENSSKFFNVISQSVLLNFQKALLLTSNLFMTPLQQFAAFGVARLEAIANVISQYTLWSKQKVESAKDIAFRQIKPVVEAIAGSTKWINTKTQESYKELKEAAKEKLEPLTKGLKRMADKVKEAVHSMITTSHSTLTAIPDQIISASLWVSNLQSVKAAEGSFRNIARSIKKGTDWLSKKGEEGFVKLLEVVNPPIEKVKHFLMRVYDWLKALYFLLLNAVIKFLEKVKRMLVKAVLWIKKIPSEIRRAFQRLIYNFGRLTVWLASKV